MSGSSGPSEDETDDSPNPSRALPFLSGREIDDTDEDCMGTSFNIKMDSI
jgi:hypothetical protein